MSQPAQAQIESVYAETWQATNAGVDVAEIHGYVAGLKSEHISVREASLTALTRAVAMVKSPGRYFVFEPAGPEDTRRRAVQDWENYAARLQRAVREKVPLLLQKCTRDNAVRRAQAAWYVGCASHPGFLPLLRAIVGNTGEDQHVRVWALHGITVTRHEDMIAYLISLLEGDMAFYAYDRLKFLTDANIQVSPEEPGWNHRVKAAYAEWWMENKDKYRYDRSRAFWT